jgi:hypothetical protein
MPINNYALATIRQSGITGTDFADLFEQLAASMEKTDSSAGLLVLNYMSPDQLPAEGELVPVVTLALKPFTLRSNPPVQEEGFYPEE